MQTTAEDAAMARYAAGDDAAFPSVYRALAPKLYAYARRRTSAEHAEDLVQQTFMHVHRARHSFVPGAEVNAWAATIARRLLIDGLRRSRLVDIELDSGVRLTQQAAASAAPEQLVEAQELAERALAALAGLPWSQRQAFELVRGEGLSLLQAAQTLGTTVAAVKQRTHRASLAVRAALSETDFTPP